MAEITLPCALQYVMFYFSEHFTCLYKKCFYLKRVLAKSTLRKFWETHAETEQYLKTWYDTVMSATWHNPNDVKNTYANASILKNGRVVFNIKGNDYPLVAKINFEK